MTRLWGRLFPFLCIFFSWQSAYCGDKAPIAVKGVLDLRQWDFERDGPVRLTGEWEMYWEQLLTGAEPGIGTSIPPSGFFDVPGEWMGKKLADGRRIGSFGYATFRLKILAPSHPQERDRKLMLYVMNASTAYRTYMNQVLLFSGGNPGKTKETSRPLYYPGSGSFGYEPEMQICFQVSNFHNYYGGPSRVPLLGKQEQLTKILRNKRQVDFFLIGAIFVIGIYHLVLFLLRRSEKAPLWLGLFCLLVALRAIQTGRYFEESFPETRLWAILYRIEYLGLYLLPPLFASFLKSLFPETVSARVTFAVRVLFLFLFLLALILAPHIFPQTLGYFHFLAIASIAWMVFEIAKAGLIRRDSLPWIALSGALVCAGFAINDILFERNLIRSGYFLHYGLFIFISCQAVIIAISNSKARKTAEYLSANLSVEVETKTRDLALRNREREWITEVAVAVQQSPKIEDITNHVGQYLNQHFGLDTILFCSVNDKGALKLLSSVAGSQTGLIAGSQGDPTPHIIFELAEETVKSNEICVFEYEENLNGYRLSGSPKNFTEPYEKRDFLPQTIISIPLRISGKVIGLMICGAKEKNSSGNGRLSVELLARLANLLSGPIYHAELFELEFQRRIRLQAENGALQTEIKTARSKLEVIRKESEMVQGELEEAKERLVQAEKMSSLGQMVAGVAHEINNPMNYISGAARNVSRELEEFKSILESLTEGNAQADDFARDCGARFETMKRHIADIRTGVGKVNEMNQALRNYSRLDPEPQPGIDIRDILRESLVILTHWVKLFTVETWIREIPAISCHPSHLEQVFVTLVANAADSLREQKVEREKVGEAFQGRILITGHEREKDGAAGIAITIEDNGKRVSGGTRERFSKDLLAAAHSDIRHAHSGLVICDKIMKNHGGSLEARDSTELNGACFEIWLPQ